MVIHSRGRTDEYCLGCFPLQNFVAPFAKIEFDNRKSEDPNKLVPEIQPMRQRGPIDAESQQPEQDFGQIGPCQNDEFR